MQFWKRKKSKKGFTLLEVIIVIIIVSVLASLALPRFFKTVEYSRAMEALENLSTVRQSMNRCYMTQGSSYTPCSVWLELDIEDPGSAPGSHFTYSFTGIPLTISTFRIQATRNTVDSGIVSSFVTIDQLGVRGGGTAFQGIK